MTISTYLTNNPTSPLINETLAVALQAPMFLLDNPSILKTLEGYLRETKGEMELRRQYVVDQSKVPLDLTYAYAANAYMLQGLWETTQFDYNPIENYRMNEKGKDTNSGNDVTKDVIGERKKTENLGNTSVNEIIGSRQDTYNTGGQTVTSTNKVSPFEQTGFVNREQTSVDNGQRNDNSNIGQQSNHVTAEAVVNTIRDDSATDTSTLTHGHVLDHELERYGNIGVTTTMQMIDSQRETLMFNIFKVLADLIVHQICVLVSF